MTIPEYPLPLPPSYYGKHMILLVVQRQLEILLKDNIIGINGMLLFRSLAHRFGGGTWRKKHNTLQKFLE